MHNKNILSDIFVYIKDVIDSADMPLVLLILVVLPLIVPVVPASVTAMNLNDVMKFPSWMSGFSGLTIELLGFASAILALRSITALANAQDETGGLWLQVFVDVGAWIFYLFAVVTINVIMDNQVGKPTWYVMVIAVLCLLSVPSSMLAASRINTRDANEKNEKRYQERRSDSMERYRIRMEANRRTNEPANERMLYVAFVPNERTVRQFENRFMRMLRRFGNRTDDCRTQPK